MKLPIIVLGDFNCPDICWHTLASHSSRSSALCDFIFDNNMSQLITYPTHHNGHILDLLFTNDPDSVGDIVTIDNCPLVSDHIPLLAELKTSASQTSHIRIDNLQWFTILLKQTLRRSMIISSAMTSPLIMPTQTTLRLSGYF